MIITFPYSEPAYTIQMTAWELAALIAVFGVGLALLNRALVHFFPRWSRRNRH